MNSTGTPNSPARQDPLVTDGDPVLEARGLRVTRGDARTLDGLSVSIPPASTTLVRGTSGAGKTTLFEILGLLDAPDGGTLRVAGRDAATLSDGDRTRLRRDHVGIVFQEFELIADLTARENARLPQEHADAIDEAWLDALFAELGIADRRDHYPRALSGGEKQRVSIARALANRPAVVLADEPTGQVDPETSATVLDLLLEGPELADAAVVVVSHETGIADRFDAVYELVDGHLDER